MPELGEKFWANMVQEKNMEISRLKKQITSLRDEIARRDKEKYIQYAMLSDQFRMRREVELMSEQVKKMEQDRDNLVNRAERAERGIRNLKKWMEIKGVKGGYLDLS